MTGEKRGQSFRAVSKWAEYPCSSIRQTNHIALMHKEPFLLTLMNASGISVQRFLEKEDVILGQRVRARQGIRKRIPLTPNGKMSRRNIHFVG